MPIQPARPAAPRRPTMVDVAKRAGVSLKTVSRVVNNEPAVARELTDRVRAAIAELGFRRNDIARNLRSGRVNATIGLLIEEIANPFYAAIASAAAEVAADHQTLLITASSEENPDRERQLLLDLCQRRVDGLLVVPAGADHAFPRREVEMGIPVVLLRSRLYYRPGWWRAEFAENPRDREGKMYLLPVSQRAYITPHRGPAGPPPSADMVWVPDRVDLDGVRPGFWIDACPVTNDEFAAFVEESGYACAGEWWHPDGPGSSLYGRGDHPVVRVTWADVSAYAQWTGKSVPTEAEWEEAARGCPDASHAAGARPVARCAPNRHGLYDVLGSVWQWTDRCCGPNRRFIRGGLRLADRIPHPVHTGAVDLGFRCVVRTP